MHKKLSVLMYTLTALVVVTLSADAALQLITTGGGPGTSDSGAEVARKVNENFTEVYSDIDQVELDVAGRSVIGHTHSLSGLAITRVKKADDATADLNVLNDYRPATFVLAEDAPPVDVSRVFSVWDATGLKQYAPTADNTAWEVLP